MSDYIYIAIGAHCYMFFKGHFNNIMHISPFFYTHLFSSLFRAETLVVVYSYLGPIISYMIYSLLYRPSRKYYYYFYRFSFWRPNEPPMTLVWILVPSLGSLYCNLSCIDIAPSAPVVDTFWVNFGCRHGVLTMVAVLWVKYITFLTLLLSGWILHCPPYILLLTYIYFCRQMDYACS